MAKGPDPRKDARPVADVPALLAAGAVEFNAARFWHAHEAWEIAWHALRAAACADEAAYLRGMILVTAALENATRGKESGFKRQMAEGLHALLSTPDAATRLGVGAARAWEAALVRLYVDACRHRVWGHWQDAGWSAPPLAIMAP